MTFTRPEMLGLFWLLPFLAGLYGYGQFRRWRLLRHFCAQAHLDTSFTDATAFRRWCQATLLVAAAGCTIVALAGPRWTKPVQAPETPPADIIVALDCSRSMLAADVNPSRLTRAKREARDLLEMLRGDRIGLVAFAGSGHLVCPLTADYALWPRFLDELGPENLPVGGSDLSQALSSARDALAAANGPVKAVIMMSDGEHNGSRDFLEAVQVLQKEGIRLFCLGIGSPQGARVPDGRGGFIKDDAGRSVHSRLEEALLKQMALRTGGSYVRAVAGTADLEAIYLRQLRGPKGWPVNPDPLPRTANACQRMWLSLALGLLLLERWGPLLRRTGAPAALAAMLLLLGLACTDSRRDGQEAYRRGDFATALARFSDAQRRHPQDAALAFNLGNVHYRLGNFPAAREAYRRALAAGDRRLQAKAHYNLGNTSFRMGACGEAARNYRAALRLDPGDREARINLERVRRLVTRPATTAPAAGQTSPNSCFARKGGRTEARDPSAASSGRQEPRGTRAYSDEAAMAHPPATGAREHSRGAPQQAWASADDRRAFEALVDRPPAPSWPSAKRREVIRDW